MDRQLAVHQLGPFAHPHQARVFPLTTHLDKRVDLTNSAARASSRTIPHRVPLTAAKETIYPRVVRLGEKLAAAASSDASS
jgi:hypothetical protein